MGLDMYLSAERYASPYSERDKALLESLKKTEMSEFMAQRANTVGVELMYWRKANAIHDWFVQTLGGGVDECQRIHVSTESLIELRDLCNEVLETPEKASELLPTSNGFFFGSTEYDEYYISDIKETSEELTKIIDEFEKDPEEYAEWWVYYQASW